MWLWKVAKEMGFTDKDNLSNRDKLGVVTLLILTSPITLVVLTFAFLGFIGIPLGGIAALILLPYWVIAELRERIWYIYLLLFFLELSFGVIVFIHFKYMFLRLFGYNP